MEFGVYFSPNAKQAGLGLTGDLDKCQALLISMRRSLAGYAALAVSLFGLPNPREPMELTKTRPDRNRTELNTAEQVLIHEHC